MAQPPRTILAGDCHLRDGSPTAFTVFLDTLLSESPGRLILLGDVFEYWIDGPAAVRRYQPVLARLRRLRNQGWETLLILGNRELAWGRVLTAASGCQVVWPSWEGVWPAGRVRAVHGDRLCHDPAYRALAAILRSFPLQVLRLVLPTTIHEWVASRLRACSRTQAAQGRPGVFLDPRRVAGAGRGVDLLLCGHLHRPRRIRTRGTNLQVCPDWGPRRGGWAEIDSQGRLTLHVWREQPGRG